MFVLIYLGNKTFCDLCNVQEQRGRKSQKKTSGEEAEIKPNGILPLGFYLRIDYNRHFKYSMPYVLINTTTISRFKNFLADCEDCLQRYLLNPAWHSPIISVYILSYHTEKKTDY